MSWDKERIVELLLEAGDMAREARKKLSLEVKSDHSLVTQADTEIEALFTEALEDVDSGRYLIGEETISRKGEDYVQAALAGEAWVVDPIDGTAPFAHFLPNWGVSVGYMKDGRLLHGGVYLPDYGELIISSGEDEFAVTEGKLEDGEWTWKELVFPPRPSDGRGLIAITQALAKRGQCLLPNPVMALGAAVVPLLGLLQGRFLAYLGSVKLWDAAGALPILVRLGFEASLELDGEIVPVTTAVDSRIYELDADNDRRWYFRSSLLIHHPGDAALMRESIVENRPAGESLRDD